MAPKPPDKSIVYTFGGNVERRGFTGGAVKAYKVATNTWSGRQSFAHIFYSNGVGKIGNKLYFSGGYINAGNLPDATRELWAYDYSNDLMIRKAPLPIFSAEGVSGVINGKLYVLPGACNGNGYPNAGYCAEEQTRRFYRYDPVTNTWVAGTGAPLSPPRRRCCHRRQVLRGGRLRAGLIHQSPPSTSTTRRPTPGALCFHAQGRKRRGAGLHGKFYVVAPGRTYAYNPVTNQWKPRHRPADFGSVARVTLAAAPTSSWPPETRAGCTHPVGTKTGRSLTSRAVVARKGLARLVLCEFAKLPRRDSNPRPGD